jgi:ADP-ribose pyrophosphatase YjhB (NUDIX family)
MKVLLRSALTGTPAAENGDEAWAPGPVFAAILQYTVIATFDLILEFPQGILLVQRRLAPYKGLWALPGLRMLKGETLEAALDRIATAETGTRVDPEKRVLVNQAVGQFRSPARQDLSTCYAFRPDSEAAQVNKEHFSASIYIKAESDIPGRIGGIYRDHLDHYFGREGRA